MLWIDERDMVGRRKLRIVSLTRSFEVATYVGILVVKNADTKGKLCVHPTQVLFLRLLANG